MVVHSLCLMLRGICPRGLFSQFSDLDGMGPGRG